MPSRKILYETQRRANFEEDNKLEEIYIKKLSNKLGIGRKRAKKRKGADASQPTWMRESGLDYLLNFEKHVATDDQNIEKSGTLGIKKKFKVINDELFGKESNNDVDTSEERICKNSSNSESENEDKLKPENCMDITDFPIENEAALLISLRKEIRRLLNCVSESQMSRNISDVVAIFTNRPKAHVRTILIDEIDILLHSFPLSRGQSVGWLQQELAACFICSQVWLDHVGQPSYLVSHLVEHLISKIPALSKPAEMSRDNDVGVLCSRCVFIAYLYRFGAFTGDLVLDIIENFVSLKDLPFLQAVHHMLNPISVNIRKEHSQRCQLIINNCKAHLESLNSEDLEIISELEAIIKCLSDKYSKEPAYLSAEHFVKLIRNWNKGISSKKETRLPLRLDELLNAGKKGRWWAVGSGFVDNTLQHVNCEDGSLGVVEKQCVEQISNKHNSLVISKEISEAAKRLGLITPIRQNLFSILMTTPGGPDSTADALIRTCGFVDKKPSNFSGHREQEMIQIIMHCLVSEQPFNRFYPRVFGALLNHHRRFGLMIKCAFWDVMAKIKLTKEAKCNAGKAIGILAVVFDFPLTVLKKYDFGDASIGNTEFLSAIIIELTSASFDKALEKFAQLAGQNPKLGRNMRIFLRRMSKTVEEEACRLFLTKLVTELRDLFV